MKILDINILKGPNYWSIYWQQLIVVRLDIEDLENFPTNKINGFYDRLMALIPSMHEHQCSEEHPGGFFERVKEGTWMGHVIEHIAIELQNLAGMPCCFGRTRFYGDKSVYNVVFSYENETAGLYAANASIRIAEALINNTYYDIQEDINSLKKIKKSKGLGPSTGALVHEAEKRKIPSIRVNDSSLVRLGHGIYQKMIQATITSSTSSMAVDLAGDKQNTKNILQKGCIPTPAGSIAATVDEMKTAVEKIGYPVVLKPINGNHGRGITTNIRTYADALKAFYLAQTISEDVIIERFVQGDDFRFLVINYKLVAVAKRTPAMIKGNGKYSIKKLIDIVNSDPKRGDGHEKVLTSIKLDEVTNKILQQKQLTLDSVLPDGEILYLKDTANISTGGTSTDVTDLVHPENKFMAERAARLTGLDICGIDVVAANVETPITNENGAVLEVNACPGLRMHLNPSHGIPRNVAKPILDMLFPENKPSRIPIVAITGTNGKTTTTRLIAHIAAYAGHKVGFCCTDGIYIQNHAVQHGDCTGYRSAQTVLSDPSVDFAVLECARGGILRSGLGFDYCNVSIVTNVSADHLGLRGIKSMNQLAHLKSVVPESTFPEGTAVLNADDDLVYGMTERLKCHIALFSMDANNPRIISHYQAGGLVSYIENGFVTLQKGDWKEKLEHVDRIPLTFTGRAEGMIKNVLPAVLAAFIENFRLEDIVHSLKTFIPSPEQTPGRMNLFSFRNFDIMIDYAHNTAGFQELQKFMERTSSKSKIGIITAPGDRRDQDIRDVGYHSANIFDHIIIRHDKDLRGRSKDEITGLLLDGIHSADPSKNATIISDEMEAMKYAMNTAQPGAFIVVCTDAIKSSTDFILKQKKQEEEVGQFEYTI